MSLTGINDKRIINDDNNQSVNDLQARPPSSVRVESIEMSSDDRHRNGQGQDARDGARRPNDAAQCALRYLVSVPDRCHGDDGPPERVRDALDLRSWDADLGVIESAGVDQHADSESH